MVTILFYLSVVLLLTSFSRQSSHESSSFPGFLSFLLCLHPEGKYDLH